jgi:D-lactate dehydrogenase
VEYNKDMKIAIYEAGVEDKDFLQAGLAGFEVVFIDKVLNEDPSTGSGQGGDAEIVSVFVGSTVNKSVLDKLPNVKCIVTRSTGYDHIDLSACLERGIKVLNVPSYGARAVAEHTFAILLTISRRTFEAYKQVREEGDFRVEKLEGFDLFGKVLGIVGTGKIGKNVARIAQGFGMNILLSDKFPDDKFASEVGGFYVPMDELLAKSDIITLHCPYTKENHHIIGEKEFHNMKKGVVLVNTARGELIDTQALLVALENKTVAHVGLDVLESERDLKDEANLVRGGKEINNLRNLLLDHELVDDERAFITPHIAFHSREADRERLTTAIESIKKFSTGVLMNEVQSK